MPPKRERNITIFKSDVGRIDHVSISGKGGLEAHYYYDSNATLSKIECSSRSDLDPMELLKIINQMFIQRIDTVHSIEKLPQSNIAEVSEGFDFVERWEKGFLKDLYYGRTGSYWFSEAGITNRDLWTAPKIVSGMNTVQHSTPPFMANPCADMVWMRNSKDGVTLDELYIAINKSFKRARFRIDVQLPTLAQLGVNDNVGFGFELNSQGGHSAPAFLIGNNGTYQLETVNPPIGGATSAMPVDVSATIIKNAPVELLMEYDYPWVRLWQYSAGVWTQLGELGPIVANAYGPMYVIPFMFNESATIVDNFYVGNIAINAFVDPANYTMGQCSQITSAAAWASALKVRTLFKEGLLIQLKEQGGVNAIDYRILGSQNDVTWDEVLCSSTTLVAGAYDFQTLTDKWLWVDVQIRDYAAPNHGKLLCTIGGA